MATSVEYQVITQWPVTDYYDHPLTITYDARIYYVSTGYFAQTPGTYKYAYSVIGDDSAKQVTLGSGVDVDVITFGFNDTLEDASYTLTLVCTDDYYKTSKSGKVKIIAPAIIVDPQPFEDKS